MKFTKLALVFGVMGMALTLGTTQVRAENDFISTQTAIELFVSTTNLDARNVIEWKVGESADYKLNMGGFINGTMSKTVDHDEGNTVWLKQNIDLSFQKQVMEVQMDRATGKILKILANGQPQEIPNGNIEIVSQDYTTITVPAGKFDCVHVVAKTEDSKNVEVWMNPRDTVMDGALKQIMDSQLGKVTLELTKFKKVN